MGNVLEKAKQEQVIALGRLGWSLRQIEAATGVRRETAGGYLRSAGIALRSPGGWGRKLPAKAATSVTTGSSSSNPAIEVITGFSGSRAADNSKPANEVITGFLPDVTLQEQGGKRLSDDWGKLLGDSAAVTAMLDRLLHHGHALKCGPRSWRTKTSSPGEDK
jgi:hypothetical protein